ncbi:MAG: holo-ACP synthase [Proteobacteria bacterium]|nr:holo-ACP synthase [Pseudomonadota bacterium]MDE3208457.1 holo-ACP synthase [Pseudomonadota bacterium]
MIHGIGTDLVSIERMENLIRHYGRRIACKILTPAELTEYDLALNPASFLAKHFAAKEAFSKAIGTGLRSPVTLQNIAIAHNTLGKPMFMLELHLTQYLHHLGIGSTFLSLADETQYALAFVIMEK